MGTVQQCLPEGMHLKAATTADARSPEQLKDAVAIVLASNLPTAEVLAVLRAVRAASRLFPLTVSTLGEAPHKHLLNTYLNLGVASLVDGHDDSRLKKILKEASDLTKRLKMVTDLEARFEAALKDKNSDAMMDIIGNLTILNKFNRNFALYLGYSHELRGDLAGAAHHYRRVAAAQPGFIQAFGMYLILMGRCARWDDVTHVFMKIIDCAGKYYQTVLCSDWWPIWDSGNNEAYPFTKKLRAQFSGPQFCIAVIDTYIRALLKLGRQEAAKTYAEKLAVQSEFKEIRARAELYRQKFNKAAQLISMPIQRSGESSTDKEASRTPTPAIPVLQSSEDQTLQLSIAGNDEGNPELSVDRGLDPASKKSHNEDADPAQAMASAPATGQSPKEAMADAREEKSTEQPGLAKPRFIDSDFEVEIEFEDDGAAPSLQGKVIPMTMKDPTTLKLYAPRYPRPATPPKLKLTLEDLPAKEIRLGQLATDVKKIFQDYHTSSQPRLAQPDPNHRRRLVFFHPQEDASAGYSKLYRDAGFLEVVEFRDPAKAFARIRSIAIEGIVAFYESDRPAAIHFLRELTIARDIEHIPTIVFCTGEEALSEFVKAANDLLFDAASILQRSRTKLEQLFVGVCSPGSMSQSPGVTMEKLHRPWLRNGGAGERFCLHLDEAEGLCVDLETRLPGTKYPDLERLWHAISSGNIDSAKAFSAKGPSSDFAYDLARFHAKVLDNDAETVALNMVETFIDRGNLTSEMLWQLTRTTDDWAAAKALGKLVKYWSTQENLRQDPQLLYAASRFFRLVGDANKERSYAAMACLGDPFRGDYHIALAELLYEAKDHKRSYDFWKLGLECSRIDTLYCKARLAEVLVLLRKKAEGAALLKEILNMAPQHATAMAIQQKYFGQAAG